MFKENFIKICNKKGVAPTVVCEKIGLTRSTFSNWKEDSVPRRATLQKFADYLDVTVEELLAENQETDYSTNENCLFWEKFYSLCKDKGKKPLQVVKELGIAAGSITKWKNGSIPRGDTLQKLADYFGVSVDYLLGKSSEKGESPPEGGLSELEKKFIELIRDLPDEQAEQLFALLKSFQKDK